MKRTSTIIRSAVAAASAVGLSLAAPVMAGGDKAHEQQEEGAQMEGTEESLEQGQQKVGGEEQEIKDKSGQKAAIDPKQVQKVFGSDVQVISIQDLPKEQITKLQEELQALGLYTGTVDGQMGPKTRNALNSFVEKQTEINEQLLRSGQVTTQMMDALGVSHADVQPVTGEEDQGLQQPMDKQEKKEQEKIKQDQEKLKQDQEKLKQEQEQQQPEPQHRDEGIEPGGVEEPQY